MWTWPSIMDRATRSRLRRTQRFADCGAELRPPRTTGGVLPRSVGQRRVRDYRPLPPHATEDKTRMAQNVATKDLHELAGLARILRAFPIQRMNLHYDKEADVLYVKFADSEPIYQSKLTKDDFLIEY